MRSRTSCSDPADATDFTNALDEVHKRRERCTQAAFRRARLALDQDDTDDGDRAESEWLGYAALVVQVDRIASDLGPPPDAWALGIFRRHRHRPTQDTGSGRMLFLLRPRQTYMPYTLPRSRMAQDAYNQQLREAYASTRRVAPFAPESPPASRRDPLAHLKELGELHRSGVLTGRRVRGREGQGAPD